MNEEQKAAFIIAQAALLNAEVAMYQAANKHRELCGNSIAYGEEEFTTLITRYEAVLGHNEVISFFRP